MSNDFDPRWPADDDADRTVVRPTPGGRRPDPIDQGMRQAPPPVQRPISPAYAPPPQAAAIAIDKGKGLNPLVRAAGPLLSLLVSMRSTRTLADVMGLRSRVVEQIRTFERDAAGGGVDPETVYAARYCLCTAVDEAVLNTPWGADSLWRDESLLSVFHRERWGGEKFFLILERMMKDPARNLFMLELLYLCLVLGFQGKYHVLTDGQRTVDQILASVYEAIRRQRGEFERDLSPHWESEADARPSMAHPVPLWVVSAIAVALLLTVYLAFSYFISEGSTPVFSEIAGLGKDEGPPKRDIRLLGMPVASASPGPAPAAVESDILVPPPMPGAKSLATQLGEFLAPEVAEHLVELSEDDTAVTVRILGDGLFASGRETLTPKYLPLIRRISKALAEHDKEIGGDVRVVGHTDNVPLRRSLRFQNNLELSVARARSVAAILRQNPAIKQPIVEEGKGEVEPLVANDTPENRAKNRRVDILIEK